VSVPVPKMAAVIDPSHPPAGPDKKHKPGIDAEPPQPGVVAHNTQQS
jgi:hypothetical protein